MGGKSNHARQAVPLHHPACNPCTTYLLPGHQTTKLPSSYTLQMTPPLHHSPTEPPSPLHSSQGFTICTLQDEWGRDCRTMSRGRL